MEYLESYRVNENYSRYLKKGKTGKIKVKGAGLAERFIPFIIGILSILTIYGFFTFDYKNLDLLEGIKISMENIVTMFSEARLNHFTYQEAFYQVLVTLSLGFLTTLIGAIAALFIGLFAAKNLSNAVVSNLIKGLTSLVRAIPTVIWVLIFAVSAGLGSVAAVIGLTFHTIGYLIKGYSEAFEEIDEGVIEALKASGANWWQIVFQAVLPSSVTYLFAWTFMRFELNFTIAVAMGAAAGAGGIGFDLFMAGGFYFDIREVGMITFMILLVAILLETYSTKLKNRYL